MPSQPVDTGWDFGPVLDLIDSDLHIAPPTSSPASLDIDSTYSATNLEHKTSQRSLRLGNFGRLFQQLGISDGEPLPPVSPVDPDLEESISSDDNYLPPLDVDTRVEPNNETVVDSVALSREARNPDGGPPFVTSSKACPPSRKKKSTKQRKAFKHAEKVLLQRERELKDLEEREDSCLLEQPTSRGQPALQQVRAQSRSNVGAKLRPATPVQLDPSPVAQNRPASPVAEKELVVNDPSNPLMNAPKPTPHQRLSSFAQPFTPGQSGHGLLSSHPIPPQNPSQALGDLGSALATQYTPFGTPTPTHYASSLAPNYQNGYFTPQTFTSAVHGHGLVPRTVQPVVPQRPRHPVAAPPQTQLPVTPGKSSGTIAIRPQTDRHVNFFNQLMFNFPEDRRWLVSPMQLSNQQTSVEGIHVFVDASNIMIGFKDILRRSSIQMFDMSFDSLALLMERRRPVAKRVFAGSHREANPLPHVTRLVEISKAVGYENNVKEQVLIRREDTERKRFFKDVEKMGWNKAVQRRSGNGSGSDSEMGQAELSTPSAPKWVEQGVDEILHLKMCQSIIDTEVPTTIVLATGDGAEAEHSDGFLAHVERALKKGWKVELVSWKQQTSGGYKNKKFRAKWGDKFRIIELDDYVESLIDTP